jgi:hypothetical protein
MADIRPLAERIEDGIRQRTEKRIDAALSRARTAALTAYTNELREPCGIPFDVVISDVLAEAEAKLRPLAIEHCQRIETDRVLARLAS